MNNKVNHNTVSSFSQHFFSPARLEHSEKPNGCFCLGWKMIKMGSNGNFVCSFGFLHCRRTLYQLSYQGRASRVVQRLKHLPAVQETWVQSLGREDPLEKKMATRSSILAWRIPWMEEPGGLQSMGSQRVRHD